MLKINVEKCTGCGACVQKCPKTCITWEKKEFDFFYPAINETLCVDCGMCEKVCSIEKKLTEPISQKVYAAVYKDKDILRNSTSGGAFSALANYVFERSGVVYGVAMDEQLQAKHIRVIDFQNLNKLRGSKYVQSYVGSTYQQVEQDVRNGKWVLYTGTPCQISGLYHYLGKKYETLLTADIICHGVGSQAYFDKYLEYAKEKHGNICEVNFRSKKYVGWSIGGEFVVEKDTIIQKPFHDYSNYYYKYFLDGDIYRACCYECKYANILRQGDFSLGDFWGVEAYHLSLETAYGCSLLFVNSLKGQKIFNEIDTLEVCEVSIEQARRKNEQLNSPMKKSEKRNVLLEQYRDLSGTEIQEQYVKNCWKSIIKGKIKSWIPYRVRLMIRNIRK